MAENLKEYLEWNHFATQGWLRSVGKFVMTQSVNMDNGVVNDLISFSRHLMNVLEENGIQYNKLAKADVVKENWNEKYQAWLNVNPKEKPANWEDCWPSLTKEEE